MSEPVVIAPESVELIVSLVVSRLAVPAPAPAMPELLSSAEVMALLGYSETEPFLAAARRAKCPMIRVNARKILFDRADVCAWLQALKAATPAPKITIEVVGPRRSRERRAA